MHGGRSSHGNCCGHGDRGSEHREVVTRPGALLEELGVARHQIGEEALGLLGEALAARGRCGTLGTARLGPLTPRAAPAPPQPDLAHGTLEEFLSVVVQRGRSLDVFAAQRPGQVAALCGKGTALAAAHSLCPCALTGAGRAMGAGWGWRRDGDPCIPQLSQ